MQGKGRRNFKHSVNLHSSAPELPLEVLRLRTIETGPAMRAIADVFLLQSFRECQKLLGRTFVAGLYGGAAGNVVEQPFELFGLHMGAVLEQVTGHFLDGGGRVLAQNRRHAAQQHAAGPEIFEQETGLLERLQVLEDGGIFLFRSVMGTGDRSICWGISPTSRRSFS